MSDVTIPARCFQVPLGQAATRIPGFRPGVDRCRIHINDMDTTLLAEHGGTGIALVLQMAAGEVVVVFPGLTKLPLADITVVVSQPGDDLQEICLDGVAAEIREGAADNGPARPSGDDPPPLSTAPNNGRRNRPITEFVLRPGQPIPSFRSFSPGAHVIEVDLTGVCATRPKVEVRPSPDGENGVLLLDGQAAAILAGAPFATADDVRVLTRGG